jgi:signal transduction histidine kinase/PAS domain-containing protein
MPKPLKVLLVLDSEEDSLPLVRELTRGGFSVRQQRVETAPALRAALRQEWDVILCDYRLTTLDAIAAIQILQTSGKEIPLIVISERIGEESAVSVIKAGANGFLLKDNLARLAPVVAGELRDAESRRKQKRMQEAVKRAKAEWEGLFDAFSDLIFVTNGDGIVYRCNGRSSDFFGGYREVIGKRIDRLFFQDAQPEGEVFRFVHSLQSRIDEDICFPRMPGWYNVTSYPINVGDSNRSGFVFIIKDITKRRKAEEDKRTSDRELLTLYAISFRLQYANGLEKVAGDLLFQLHNMLQMDFSAIHMLERGKLVMQASLGLSPACESAIATMGKDSRVTALALAGRPFLGNRPDHTFSPKARAAAVRMGLRSWCAVPLMIGQEVVGLMTVGTRAERTFNDREVFLLSSIARQLGVLMENYNLYDQMKDKAEELYRNREALKANLQQVERANQELDRLNTAKNNFIGIASHELKTPITSVLGGVEFLLKYSDLPMTPEQHNILASVYEGAAQLRKLVEDLLSISRIEAHGMLTKKPADLIQLCREAQELFVLPLSERRIKVQVEGDQSRVPVEEGFALLAVKNLLENAIKFTPDGGEVYLSGRVVKRSEVKRMADRICHFYHGFPNLIHSAKQFYLLQVKDTGIGIPLDEQVRIFDKFYGVGDIAHHSSGGTAFMSKGSGLGLSIVRGIMDVHEGAVWVDATEGEGSTFSLLFPITQEQEPIATETRRPRRQQPPVPAKRRLPSIDPPPPV